MTDRQMLEKLRQAAHDYLHALSNRTVAIAGTKLGEVLKDVDRHCARMPDE